MSLRRKFVLYLLLVHLPFVGLAVYVFAKNRPLLLAVEALFLVSFLSGLRLVHAFFKPLDLIRSGAQFIQESDFGSRFREVGQPDMNHLVRTYNKMVDHLREERIRLEEQHYFLEKVLNASPLGIITLDYDGGVATLNPSARRLLQLPEGAVEGRSLSEIEGLLGRELESLERGTSRMVAILGSRRVRCSRSEFLDRGFARSFFVIEELTEELRQSEKAAYEKLIRMMSHEVNNSIGAASSLLESCLNYKDQLRKEDRSDFESALRVVIGRSAQLGTFMRGFSEVVRIPAPNLQQCDLHALLEEVVGLHRAEAERHRIRWGWEIEDGALDAVLMDRAQMEQAFVNIIKNAIEAIGDDGTITIRAGRVEAPGQRTDRSRVGRRWLVIEDTGGGITPEVRENLFTPFFSTKRNGQGIGLTMVQEILTQHRFEFSLGSGPPSSTRFTVLL